METVLVLLLLSYTKQKDATQKAEEKSKILFKTSTHRSSLCDLFYFFNIGIC